MLFVGPIHGLLARGSCTEMRVGNGSFWVLYRYRGEGGDGSLWILYRYRGEDGDGSFGSLCICRERIGNGSCFC